jgi:hypothetical protein
VALVLRDKAHLDAMDYTAPQVVQAVYDGMACPPAPTEFPDWLDEIRGACTGRSPAPGEAPGETRGHARSGSRHRPVGHGGQFAMLAPVELLAAAGGPGATDLHR